MTMTEFGVRPTPTRTLHRRAILCAIVVASLVAWALVPLSAAKAEDTVPFSITIRHISCIDPCDAEGLEAAGEGTPDFYAKVFINGEKMPAGSDKDDPSTPTIDDDDSIDPVWTVATNIPASVVNVPVTIQVWDDDGSSGPDLGDASPRDGDRNLDISVIRQFNTWVDPTADGTGDGIESPQSCSSGNGEDGWPAVKVCFDIGGDTDGDGLLDSWERNGYDDNGDGNVDVNLPAMGANPECKDLYLELDEANNLPANQQLTRADIRAMKAAFAAAPPTAGTRAGEREGGGGEGGSEDTFGRSAPPDRPGCRGINLHVDTGGLVDETAVRGQAPGTCADGIDNGTDGTRDGEDTDCTKILKDDGIEAHLDSSAEDPATANCTGSADPTCLVGDPEFASGGLGGGGAINDPMSCKLDDNFYRAKNGGGFNPVRKNIFRYAIRANQRAGCEKPTGGQGELGGNDFISFNRGGGTLMHELGHTLNLFHGGINHAHCKPNFVSVMNYNLQYGIPRVTGGTILDYSPPRIALNGDSRGVAPLPMLDEDELSENTILDPSDTANQFAFTNEGGTSVRASLSQNPNWNGDADPPLEAVVEDVNIDDDGTDGTPEACDNDSDDELRGADDWSYVSLAFHGFGEKADAAVRPETDDVPTSEDLERMWRSLNTTDLAVTQSDAPDPVAAGTDLVYTVTVQNRGLNPADSVQVVDTLPADVTFKSSNAGCRPDGQTLTCNLGHLAAAGSRTFTITVGVPADLVYRNGGPKVITNTVRVENLAGPDADPANNTAAATTKVIAVADVRVTAAESTSPLEVLIGEPATASLEVTTDNLGPSTPIDAVLTATATGGAGVTVTPASWTSAQNALAVGSPRKVTFAARLECTSPGVKTVDLTAELALKNADDVDPDLANNRRSASFRIDCVVPIAINVRPGGFPNSINLNTDATVAALTTRAGEYGLPLDFDATSIDVSRTYWGLRNRLFNVATPAGAQEVHGIGHPERSYELDERTRDADTDLILHFKPSESGLTLSSTQACLKGKYQAPDGNVYSFLGCDSVRVVN